MVLRWLSIAVLAVAAWVCPPAYAVAACLVAMAAWSLTEISQANWAEWLPGHLVRLIVVATLVAFLAWLRRQLSTARRQARVDELTELPNRQALIEALEAEIDRSKRFGRPFSLAMMDCDGFKQINDLRGHLTGDEVLKRIGIALRQQTRPFDCAGRWGGDEFLIILSEVDNGDARLIAERLRAAMRHHVERHHPTLKFSIGVVTVRSADLNWQECVKRADDAMYAAKRIGPDQTTFEIVERS